MHPAEEWDDGIVIGNPNDELTATITIFKIPEGKRKEELVEGFPLTLAPGDAIPYRINTSFIAGLGSRFRTGGMFRIVSDIPVIAYQHSPFENNQFNDSSLLLPESVLGRNYVIASYPPVPNPTLPTNGGRPSYFEVIATEDLTTVEWTPKVATHGDGLPITPVIAGETGSMRMNRFDTMRITASNGDEEIPLIERDLSGTVVTADKPIWVVGATRCSGAPVPALFRSATCDNIQELLFPLEQWGRKYVAAAPPPRDEEWVHWRIYAGAPDMTITSEPPLADFPHTFGARGDFIDVSVPPLSHFVIEGDAPFMPVLHLQSHVGSIWTDETQTEWDTLPGTGPDGIGGDPAMAQTVPVEQFLQRYVFITGIGYNRNWVIVIRRAGRADVFVDGDIVGDYALVGDYEVAHFRLTNIKEDDTDVHVAESQDSFGIVQVGYSNNVPGGEEGADGCINPNVSGYCRSSYAHPGGMKSEVLHIP